MALKKINKNAQGVPTGEYTDVAGGTLYADVGIGTILPYGGTSDKIPQGYLLCDGTSLLRASYPELFAVIGTAFGSADSTHFNIPDLRGEFLRGAGTNSHSGQGSGGSVGQHQNATAVPYVSNRAEGNTVVIEQVAPTGGNRANVVNSDSSYNITTNSVYGAYQSTSSSTPANQQLTVRPTNTSVNFIIKAVQVALPADLASGVEEYINDNATSEISSSNKLVTESDLNTVTSGNATRNTTYVSSTGFNATWNKTGRVCMASLTFNLAQNTTSTEEIITGFPAPIADVDIVAQGANNTTVSNLILKTNGNIRTHYGGTANQFYQVTFTYITAS